MISFKGILKYSIYLFIAGWMFLLGIMVGRGNSPVTFDTQEFQNRLETIAEEFGKTKEQKEKVELKFYDVLEKPVPEEGLTPKKNSKEIIPKKESDLVHAKENVKTSLKKQTFKRQDALAKESPETSINNIQKKTNTQKKAPAKQSSKPAEKKAATIAVKKPEQIKKATPQSGKYTIQIAAYKNFKDAVTQMAVLEKKGFSSYRVKGQKDGETWYRVRTGSFATYDEAKSFKQKLKKAKINSMILKKDI